MRKAADKEIKIACSLFRIEIDENEEEKNNEKSSTNDQSLIGLVDVNPLTINENLRLEQNQANENKNDESTMSYNSDKEISAVNNKIFPGVTLQVPQLLGNLQNPSDINEEALELHEETTESPTDELIIRSDNRGRRESITNVAISSSIAASLIGISSQVPTNLLTMDNNRIARSGTRSSISICSTNPNDDLDDVASRFIFTRRKSRLPLLRLHMPQPHSWSNFSAATSESDGHDQQHHHQSHHHHHHHFPHIPVPTFSFTNDGTARKFSFGIRRHSQTVSWQSDLA